MLSNFSPVALSVRQYVVNTFFVVNTNAAKMSLSIWDIGIFSIMFVDDLIS